MSCGWCNQPKYVCEYIPPKGVNMNKVWYVQDSNDDYHAVIVAVDIAQVKLLLNRYYAVPDNDPFADGFLIKELSIETPDVVMTNGW